MGKITYDNKIQLNENANIPNNQKCRAVDMNEIKNIVNGNDDEFIQYKSNIATGETYSTNEIKTNKVWIDGKPIYRKVYEISSLPNNGRMYVACNIPNVQHVITMRGVMESSTEWDSMPSAYTGGTLIDSLVIERTGNTLTNIRILNNTNRSGFSAFVILEYTKTTD